MVTTFAKQLLVKLKEYQKVALFVHIKPDFDAYAAAFAFRKWLKDNFPSIKTYLMIPPGTIKPEEEFLFKHKETLPQGDELSDSLGIVLDTPNEGRILTDLYTKCNEIIVIDHHPKSHPFSELEFIDPTYPAVSQMLAEIFFYLEEEHESKYIFDEEMAQYFYAGIITDTNNFLSISMLPSTFLILSKLVSKGLNRAVIHKAIFNKTLHLQLLEKKIIEQCRLTKNGLIFSIISKDMIVKHKIKNIPNLVATLENVPNIEVWSTLTYEPETKKWNCSIRSKDLNISEAAKLYGGGGHKKMSAASLNSKFKYYQLLATLDHYLKQQNFSNVTVKDQRNCWQLTLVKFLGLYKRL